MFELPLRDMKVQVNRISVRLNPDVRKVIPRFFNTGDERARALIHRVLLLPDSQVNELLLQVQQEFQKKFAGNCGPPNKAFLTDHRCTHLPKGYHW